MDGGLPGRSARLLQQQPRGLIAGVAVVLTLLVGLLDYLTGPELASLLFYLVPVAVAGGAGRRGDAIAVGVLAGACWFAAEALRGRHYDIEWLLFWGALSRMVVFCLVGALLTAAGRSPAQALQGPRCGFCGSDNTVELQRNLVCLACRRVFTPEQTEQSI